VFVFSVSPVSVRLEHGSGCLIIFDVSKKKKLKVKNMSFRNKVKDIWQMLFLFQNLFYVQVFDIFLLKINLFKKVHIS